MSHRKGFTSEGAFPRRTFLRGTLGVGGAVFAGGVLAAWGGGSGSGGSAAAPASRPPIGEETGELQVFEWSGYEIEEFWQPYKTEHAAEHPPNFTFYATDDEAITKVRSGFKPDIAHPCSGRISDWVNAGLVEEIDTSLLSNFPNLNPALVAPGTIDGKQYWVPWDWGFSSLIFNPEVVDAGADSWSLLWDPKYAGKMSMWDNPTTALRIGGLYVGVDDVYDMTDEELEAAKAALIEQKKLNRNYWSAQADMVADYAAGNIVVTNGWTSAYLALVDDGQPAEFGEPKEGKLAFNCGFVIIKGTPRYHLAHEWIDAFLDPGSGAALSNMYAFGASNTESLPLVDEGRRDLFNVSDPSQLEPPNTWLDAFFPRRDEYIKVWDEVKAA